MQYPSISPFLQALPALRIPLSIHPDYWREEILYHSAQSRSIITTTLPTLQFFLPRLLPIEVTVFSRFSCLKQHSISDGIPYCSATAYVVRGLLAGIRELMHEIKV